MSCELSTTVAQMRAATSLTTAHLGQDGVQSPTSNSAASSGCKARAGVTPVSLGQSHRGTNSGTDRTSAQLQCNAAWGSVKSQFTSSSERKAGQDLDLSFPHGSSYLQSQTRTQTAELCRCSSWIPKSRMSFAPLQLECRKVWKQSQSKYELYFWETASY